MNIQKLGINYGNNFYNYDKTQTKQRAHAHNPYQTVPLSYYNGISFMGVRVDKSLKRFYEVNKDRMPLTVKNFIEKLEDKSSMTPIAAQAAAFSALAGLATVEEIKECFHEEELFSDLKNPNETNAPNGILYTLRENRELLDLYEKDALKSKENLTVWLVKKLFMECKTLDEINKDFKKEADEEFYKLNEPRMKGDEVFYPSTLDSLGIKRPDRSYVNSLRYTRDGYADMIGEKISQAQIAFWESLSPEQRTAKARKSVEGFEKWWNSMSRDEQLELIALEADELKLLEEYSIEQKEARKSSNPQKRKTSTKPYTPNEGKEKIDNSLSRDDLFKIWAGNHLKIFKASLTEYDKEIINAKRVQRRIEIWSSMTPAEKTEYINRMREGSEILKYAMIDAWNACPEIIVELGRTLKKNQNIRPVEYLYAESQFSEEMSNTMSEFWEKHPDFAEKLGTSISNAYQKIKEAKSDGRFEQLKVSIIKDRESRMKETSAAIKNYREILPDKEYQQYPDYMKDFIDAYASAPDFDYKTLPKSYLSEFFELTHKIFKEEAIKSWTKILKREPIDALDLINLEVIKNFEPKEIAQMNRALESTLAAVLLECTGDPEVYLMSTSDCKVAMKQISDGKENIQLYSNKTGRNFIIPIIRNKVETAKIDKLYEWYRQPIKEDDARKVIGKFFDIDTKNYSKDELIKTLAKLHSYIMTYGWSNEILFIDGSPYNIDIRRAFAKKFKANMPANINREIIHLRFDKPDGFEREDRIRSLNKKIRAYHSKNNFPQKILDVYISTNSNGLRTMTPEEIKNVENLYLGTENLFNRRIVMPLMRKYLMPAENLEILCAEQTLADAIYKATGEAQVYALELERLMELIADFSNNKNKKETEVRMGKDDTLTVKLKRPINLYNTEKIYTNYLKELEDYYYSCPDKSEKLDLNEMMYILNPDENRAEIEKIDNYTMQRIQGVSSNLNQIFA